MGEEEALPDHLRCKRTDGRQWRCSRRVMDNVKLCEIHYLQGRHRQYREKVPESLKLQRKRKKGLNKNDSVLNNVDVKARKVGKMAKMMKKRLKVSDDSEATEAPVRKKVSKEGDKKLELIKMVLKREVEKRKKKKKQGEKRKKQKEEFFYYSEGELTKELPNGIMAISGAPMPQEYCNVGSHCDVKVSDDHKAITPRYFRSKNAERLPLGKLQVVPYGSNLRKGKRKKCHWCQRSDSWNLIKCSSCQKEFFCMDCIKERYFDTQNEVKKACPVCRRTCTCKDCLASQCKDNEIEEFSTGKNRVDRILHFHYLICMLLPVLKQINEDQNAEIEREAKTRGKRPSDIHIKQVDICGDQNYCNHCKTPILDLHRSCPSCSYCLCLSCLQLCRENTSGKINSSVFELKAGLTSKSHLLDKVILCPPTDLGGCGDSALELKCVFPLSWIKEMEVKAEEIVCSYDIPETSDKSLSSCSLCLDIDHKVDGFKQLKEAALREDSNDNYMFNPTLLDISDENFEHFQKHWGKGHPLVVRDVLQSTSNLSWDPLVMFCSYLEKSIARYENDKDKLEACLDWFEVEINIRQFYTGPLKCQPWKNTWHEMLKLNGWLSSQLFKEEFPAHFAAVIDALPLQEYMNPTSGILNLAVNLAQGSRKHELGPYVHLSYASGDEQSDFATKLCYDSYDVVNIMAHASDIPLPTEQLIKIRKLLKKLKTLCCTKPSKITDEQEKDQRVKVNSLLPAEDNEEKMHFFRRVDRTACISVEAQKAVNQSIGSKIFLDGECDSDSEPPLLQHGTVQSTNLPPHHNNCRNPFESSNNDRNKTFVEHSGAQWDVFRRQDVPKLIEYLKRHSDEFSHTHDYHKKMVHPLLDQCFFLDNTHKMKLKEEFKIEPWTFEQHVGEAVLIPAGCPYQIRNSKCCVHVVLEFVSPENATECIQLIDEARRLPPDHKSRVDHLDVKKMALDSMNSAIKEIRELTCKM
ncbi:lysine-specific demethylase JMJ25-like [Senna tora]|uniref:Lysine-specific demethylase JMJ25-like n=1 Tax=Senna tora TaxID=362788 RepID=A0A834W029_9FABA|nr:lysine-specific demethylase JMJ25-like [Senna tora]